MSIRSRLFGGSNDVQAQPKNEEWQVDTTVPEDDLEQLALVMETCERCKRGYMCAVHAYQFNAIDEYED